jgi:hypothetical protein
MRSDIARSRNANKTHHRKLPRLVQSIEAYRSSMKQRIEYDGVVSNDTYSSGTNYCVPWSKPKQN